MSSIKIFRYVCLIIPLFLVSCDNKIFRHQSPAFTVSYPSYMIETENPQIKFNPNIIFDAKYNYANVRISVMDKPKELEQLADSAQFQIGAFKLMYPRSCDHAIIKEELITLKDGTRAMSTLIKWRLQPGYPMITTSTVRAFKDKKVIAVNSTMPETMSAEYTEKITHSLEFGDTRIAQQKDAEQVIITQQKEQSRKSSVKPVSPENAIRVAVMDFRANGISQLIASNISELVRNELIIMGNFIVLERSQVDQILKEQGFQMTGCTETSCAVKVGQMLSAKKILVGTVMKMGNKIVISGRIVDVEKGVGERAANQSASSTDELDEAAGKFARMLDSN